MGILRSELLKMQEVGGGLRRWHGLNFSGQNYEFHAENSKFSKGQFNRNYNTCTRLVQQDLAIHIDEATSARRGHIINQHSNSGKTQFSRIFNIHIHLRSSGVR